MYHTGTWAVWLVAAALPAFIIHNPLYSVLIMGAAWIVYLALGRTSPMGSNWGSFVKVGLFLFALTIPFNALSIHMGRLVLFRIPQGWPIVGGPITLEAIVAGIASGLALLAILVVFAAFNSVVDHYQLLRATPAFLFHAGVVISIAITFVPQMVLSAKDIRQAQRIRGHRFRGLRDLLPLIMPLLANALERAIQLAETMEARGYGSTMNPLSRRQALYSQAGTLLALLGMLAGLLVVAFFSQWRAAGWALAALGTGCLMLIFAFQGRQVRRTRYRRPGWTWRDRIVVAACALVVAVVAIVKLVAPQSLYYSPYPPNSLLPPFDPVLGAALLMLALPALLIPSGARHSARDTEHVS